MGRVSGVKLDKLCEFLDSLPGEAKEKCSLCNKTLTHIVKQAEVKAGVGTKTVTDKLAEEINKNAAPQDKISGEQLRGRVRQQENDRNLSGHNDQIENEKEVIFTDAKRWANMAITNMERINEDDPNRVAALNRVKKWIEKELLK